jgi:sortase A
VTLDDLTRGPGHYPGTAMPGEDGNMGIAGHRTTYGAPFFYLDQLEPDDEIHVTDREGETHVYRMVENKIVLPGDAWVLDPDPIDNGEAMLTLTTCHPRFSARQRMVVFAELVS